MEADQFLGVQSPLRDAETTGWARVAASLGLVGSAFALWWSALPAVDPRAMTDLGLVSVLPPSVFVALLLLTASFALTIQGPRLRPPLVLLHLAVLVFMLFGITALVEETPRFASNWKLAGIADFIRQTGTSDPTINAFFNWPGFFILSAFVTDLTGMENPIRFAAWAHVFWNVLFLGPLVVLLRAATSDERVVWLGVWLFYITNWIGQDYLAPQAMNYFFYLTILAVLLTWFAVPAPARAPAHRLRDRALAGVRSVVAGWRMRTHAPQDPWLARQRVGLMAIVILLFVVMVPSHQLTPFAMLAVVTSLIAFNRILPRGLPVLMLVVLGTWISFATVPYLAGHIENVTGPVGEIGQNVQASVTRRLTGSAEHRFVLYSRLAMSAALWGLAFVGGLRRLRQGYWDVSLALLAAVPFGLLGVQEYGGELILRIYLFSLPGMVFFAATLFYPTWTAGRSWQTTAAIGLASVFLLAGFQFTRYGNERADYYTPQEVEAIQYLYTVAEPGSQLLALTDALPWRFEEFDTYRYRIVDELLIAGTPDAVARRMADPRYPRSYLIVSRGQRASAEVFYGLPPGEAASFEQALLTSGDFDVIFANEDARIFVLAEQGGE